MTAIGMNHNYSAVKSETVQGNDSVTKADNAIKNDHVDDIDAVMRDIGVSNLDTDKVINILKEIVELPKLSIISDDENYISALVQDTREIIEELEKNPQAVLSPSELLLLINNHQKAKREGDFKDDANHIDMRAKMILMQFTINSMQLEQAFKAANLQSASSIHSGCMEIANSMLLVKEPGNPVFNAEQAKQRDENLVLFNDAFDKAGQQMQRQARSKNISMLGPGCNFKPQGLKGGKNSEPTQMNNVAGENNKTATRTDKSATNKETAPEAGGKKVKQVAADKRTEREKVERIKEIKQALSEYQQNIAGILGTKSAVAEFYAKILHDSVDIFKKVCKAVDRQNNQDKARQKEDKLQIDALVRQMMSQDLLKIFVIISQCNESFLRGK